MQGIDWGVIFFYFAGLLIVGFVFARKAKTCAGMFNANKQSPWWLSGVSAYMTMFSAGTFVVWGGISYKYGLVGAILCTMYGVAAFIAGKLFAPKWHNTALDTGAEFIHYRFGKGAFQFNTSYRMIMMFANGLSLYGLAKMLCPLIPLQPGNILRNVATGNLSVDITCIILAAIIISYTMLGGLWAVLMTDMLQFFVLTTCVILVVPLILNEVGGIQEFIANVPQGFFKPTAPGFSWFFLLGWMTVNLFQLGAEWHYIQRHLCVPTARDAQKAMYLFGTLYIVTPFLWMAPPMIYRAINPAADPEEAYILACKEVLPVGMIGMMIAAMFSATASSLSSLLNVNASVLTDDVYKAIFNPQASEKATVFTGRIITLCLGMFVLAGALILPRIADYSSIVFTVAGLILPALLLPILWGLWSKKIDSKAIWICAIANLILGIATKFGISRGGYLAELGSLSWLSHIVQKYSRETDVAIGIFVPLLILFTLEKCSKTNAASGFIRLTKEIEKSHVKEIKNESQSLLPIKIIAWFIAILAFVILLLIPLSAEKWSYMLSMAMFLFAACIGFFISIKQGIP